MRFVWGSIPTLIALCIALVGPDPAFSIGVAPPGPPIEVQVLDSETGSPVTNAVIIYEGNRSPRPTLRQALRSTWWSITHPRVKRHQPKFWDLRDPDTLRTGSDGVFAIHPRGPTWIRFQAPGYASQRIQSPEAYLSNDRCCGCKDTLYVSRAGTR